MGHFTAAALFAAFASAVAATEGMHREVTHLPGWEGPLPSRWFSGFGDAGPPPGDPSGRTHMHYIFIESESSPSADPVAVWYNGGPGASSMFGLLVELGPLLLNVDSLTGNISEVKPTMRCSGAQSGGEGTGRRLRGRRRSSGARHPYSFP